MKKKKYKKMKRKEVDKIKKLHEAGLSQKQISDYTGRSTATVSSLSKADWDYDQYKRDLKESYREKELEKVIVPADSVPTLSTDNSESETVMSVLQSINKNLERLADAWEKKPKRRLF